MFKGAAITGQSIAGFGIKPTAKIRHCTFLANTTGVNGGGVDR